MTYESRQAAIHHEIIKPLGKFAAQHDVDAIADEVIAHTSDGYQLAVTQNAFWTITGKHAK